MCACVNPDEGARLGIHDACQYKSNFLDTSRKATTYGKLLEPLGLYEDDKYRIDCLSLISCRRGNALAWSYA